MLDTWHCLLSFLKSTVYTELKLKLISNLNILYGFRKSKNYALYKELSTLKMLRGSWDCQNVLTSADRQNTDRRSLNPPKLISGVIYPVKTKRGHRFAFAVRHFDPSLFSRRALHRQPIIFFFALWRYYIEVQVKVSYSTVLVFITWNWPLILLPSCTVNYSLAFFSFNTVT